MDRARRLRRDMARDTPREAELPEQPLHPDAIPRNVRIELAVGALEPGVGDESRSAVTGPRDVDHLEITRLYGPAEMNIVEIQSGRRSPVAKQPRLDVFEFKRLPQQRIAQQVDLADRQIISGPPPSIDQTELGGRQIGRAHV